MADGKSAAYEDRSGERRAGILDNRAVILLVIVLVQVLLAVGLTQLVILPRLGAQTAGLAGAGRFESGALPERGVLVDLGEIIVTLDAAAAKPRYLRIDLSLEVVDDDAVEAVGERIPELRDVVIMALSRKTVGDLADAPGKQRLRDEIFRDVAARLPAGTLLNVYFSDLVMQ